MAGAKGSTQATAGTRSGGTARARILNAAAQRFYANGIAATGIDSITASAGVAKMSLYNNFSSKAALVEAYIEARHEEWLGLYEARLAGKDTAGELVLAVFDAYIDHAASAYEHGFRGCGLLNAAAELAADDPARAAVRRHKEQVEQILAGHLAELAGPDRAERLAEHFCFLLEGAMVRAGLEGGPQRLLAARELAAGMLAGL
ncbi:TetR family transcriptional regulator [Arthrobacter crystallopoietes BAB-32]|uniref:TetR family transcriptional regulator n=1 Tax=Arthrobacter crystallopoietes BAB-32 TaxID=1246476 RepID=N1V6P1_9MICC|nr:TetR/AcrR family transcriptional regulator [Arthrobacter crystallopoietes]EMY33913.1 TetR family transcriptional regulator [Arthrobacter crystallopoietes BAB-32]